MAKKVYSVDDAPTYSKVDKVYVVNPEGGGGGGGGPVPPHNHDDRYYTKEQIDGSINHVAETLQGRVKTSESDTPDFLVNKVDNVTLSVEGNELKVKSVDGLTIGVAQLSSWLSGTSGNIQNQIDGILGTLTAMSSGMRYRGKFEVYAELAGIGDKNNGDLAVVLTDETRDDARSLYVYNDALEYWDFVGAFEFSDEFITLSDTPASYVGADGKYVRVDEANGKLVFADVDYGGLANKPTASITQIDDAVAKRHDHTNKTALDRIGVDGQGRITIDGVPYAPKQQERKFLQAYRTTDASLEGPNTIVFDNHRTGTIAYDPTTGHFTVEEGKSYVVTCNVVMDNISEEGGAIPFFLIDAETDAVPTEIYAAGLCTQRIGLGSFTAVFTAQSTRELKVRTSLDESKSYRIRHRYTALSVYEF